MFAADSSARAKKYYHDIQAYTECITHTYSRYSNLCTVNLSIKHHAPIGGSPVGGP